MNYRIPAFLIAAGLLTIGSYAQTPRIVVQGTGAPQVFTDFVAAVAAAQANDKIYLSGGTFPYTGGLVIDKPLHFIGAGIIPDSSQATGVTTLNGVDVNEPLYILTEAAGSSFTGIRFTRTQWDGSSNTTSVLFGTSIDNDAPTGVIFKRCWFQRHLVLGHPSTPAANTNTIIDECLFMGNLYGESHTATVTRSIFNQGVFSFWAGLVLENCIVMNGVQNTWSAIIRNCYLRSGGNGYCIYGCDNCIIENNISPNDWMTSGSPGAVLTNNLVQVDPAAVFVLEDNAYYEVTDDVHMLAGSPGIGHGTDGNDIGIHGTSAPYKPGGVPYNPHFRSAVIAPATNPNGELPVNIRVAAQTD